MGWLGFHMPNYTLGIPKVKFGVVNWFARFTGDAIFNLIYIPSKMKLP